MRKCILIPLFLLPIVIFASSRSEFLEIYDAGLDQNPTYQSAEIQLIKAQNDLDTMTSFFIPKLKVTSQSGITFTASGLSTRFLSPKLVFSLGILNLYSIQIGVSLPFDLRKFNFETPELSVSRNLIVENQANILQAKSALSSALWAIQNIRWSYLTTMVQNIFDWYYYNQMINIYSQKVRVLKNVYSLVSPMNQTQKNSAYQQLLSARSTLENYKESLESIQSLPNFTPYSTKLYKETVSFISSITSNISTNANIKVFISKRDDIRALEYQYRSSKTKASFWFFPFVPNPTITFVVPLNDISKWSISFSINFSLLNGGANIIQSQQRLANAKINRENLLNATTTDISNLNTLLLRQRSLQIDLEKAQNSVQSAFQFFQTAQALYQKGLENADNYTLAQLSYLQALTNKEKDQQQILLNKIKIAQMEGFTFGGEEF